MTGDSGQPRTFLEMAIEWLADTHDGRQPYLTNVAGLNDDDLASLRALLIA